MNVINNMTSLPVAAIKNLDFGATFLNSQGSVCCVMRNGETTEKVIVDLTHNTVHIPTQAESHSSVQLVKHSLRISNHEGS